MRNTMIILLCVLCSPTIFAQAPEAFKYQAVVRDNLGILITEQAVGIQIEILKGAADGTAVYTETHSATTNTYGLVNLEIGSGTTTDDLAIVNWGDDDYFLQISLDATGGTSYELMGTSQLLSVPYALHSSVADSIKGISSGGHYVGEVFGGGIVFWVSPDGMNGLVASFDDLDAGSGVTWSNVINDEIGPTARYTTDGAANSSAIIAQSGHTNSAAQLCADYVGDGYNDWYLPSISELLLLSSQGFLIDYVLSNDSDGATNGFTQIYIESPENQYWSSTEVNGYLIGDTYYGAALSVNPITGEKFGNNKSDIRKVRAIRAF